MMYCTQCKIEAKATAKFCPRCGGPLTPQPTSEIRTLQCPQCGKIYSTDHQFCADDGSQLEPQRSPMVSSPKPSPTTTPAPVLKIVLLVIGLLFLAALGAGGYLYFSGRCADMPILSRLSVPPLTQTEPTISVLSDDDKAHQIGDAYIKEMITECNGLSYLKSEDMREIREYKGKITIALHEPPYKDPKGIEWGGGYEINASKERMNFQNEGWTDDLPMPLLFSVQKIRGQWKTSGLKKATCDEVQELRTNGPRWPFTSTRLLVEDDLKMFSKDELSLMRNEIYAKHGRVFARQDLQGYFDSQPWYRRNPAFKDYDLTTVEIKNISFIKRYE